MVHAAMHHSHCQHAPLLCLSCKLWERVRGTKRVSAAEHGSPGSEDARQQDPIATKAATAGAAAAALLASEAAGTALKSNCQQLPLLPLLLLHMWHGASASDADAVGIAAGTAEAQCRSKGQRGLKRVTYETFLSNSSMPRPAHAAAAAAAA